MAVYMNAKGTTNASFQVGKRGNKIFGGVSTPASNTVASGDIWFDNANGTLKFASVSGNTVSWANIVAQGDAINSTDLVVTGNLTVTGTQTTVNTQTLNVEDNIITLNSNFTGADNIVDGGIEIERGDETNVSFLWDESEGEWTLGVESLRAGDFIGTLHGNVVGSIAPNGTPNTLTGNTINGGAVTITGSLDVSGASITGANTSSISEGTNQYYTVARANSAIDARLPNTDSLTEGATNLYYTDARSNSAIDAYVTGGTGIVVSSGTISANGLTVNEFVTSAYDATGDTWSDDDSTFATTAAIADRIDAQIDSSANIVHITGTETITGDKTISGATLTLTANSTLDVSNATITGANSDSISEGSTNLYYTNPRARQALQVSDDSGQLSYSNGTGIFSFTNNRLALSGGTMSGNIDMGNSSVLGVDTLRINENGTGLRMTNVGAFDNSGGDFRIFSTSNLILATNGENGTAVTFDQTTKDATFQGNIIVNSLTYPTADGTADQVLTTDGNGTLSFTTVNANPDGSNTQVQFNNAGSFGASTGFTFDDSNDTLSTGVTKSISFEHFTDYDVISNTSAIASDLGSITSNVGAKIDQGLLVVDYGYPILPSVEVAKLPSGQPTGTFVFCPNEAGGATIVFYDGTNWRRPSDNGIVS